MKRLIIVLMLTTICFAEITPNIQIQVTSNAQTNQEQIKKYPGNPWFTAACLLFLACWVNGMVRGNAFAKTN